MINEINEAEKSETIGAYISVMKIEGEYTSSLQLDLPDTEDPAILYCLLNELSDAFNDCKFKLDRVIDQI